MRKLTLAVLMLFTAVAACSDAQGSERTIVASVYPLAFAAERIAGPSWDVIDLTPPGGEAHDLELTLEQRTAIADAEIVLYLGDIGFQPQVESTVAEANGLVRAIGRIEGSPGDVDPHFWLEPEELKAAGADIAAALKEADPGADVFLGGYDSQMDELARRYEETLQDCTYRTLIVPHEAFGYLTQAYGLEQFGLAGITPEAEPTAERLAEARRLVDGGEAGAVFYDEHEDSKRIADSLAADAGVPSLPLVTLEANPYPYDLYGAMEELNLASLEKGLQCR